MKNEGTISLVRELSLLYRQFDRCKMQYNKPLFVELVAIYDGLTLAIEIGIKNIFIGSDSTVAIVALKGSSSNSNELNIWITEAKNLLFNFSSISLSFS